MGRPCSLQFIVGHRNVPKSGPRSYSGGACRWRRSKHIDNTLAHLTALPSRNYVGRLEHYRVRCRKPIFTLPQENRILTTPTGCLHIPHREARCQGRRVRRTHHTRALRLTSSGYPLRRNLPFQVPDRRETQRCTERRDVRLRGGE